MDEMDPRDITPETLRLALTQPGRSQAELARRLGKDTSAVNRMVKGERQIKAAELPVIAAYLSETADPSKRRTPIYEDGDPVAKIEIRNLSSRLIETQLSVFVESLVMFLLLTEAVRRPDREALHTVLENSPIVGAWMAAGLGLIDKEERDALVTLASIQEIDRGRTISVADFDFIDEAAPNWRKEYRFEAVQAAADATMKITQAVQKVLAKMDEAEATELMKGA